MHIASPLYAQELILDYGTNYEFSGSITRKLAPMVSGTCGNYSCVSEEPVAPASFSTPARDELGHWDVSTAEANEDTVWVNTRLVSNYLTYLSCVCQTCTEQCPFYSILMTITPPILGARWYGGSGPGVWLDTTVKDGATNIDLFGLESPASMDQLKIALLPHVKYTFDGWFVNREMGSSCLQERCGFMEDLNTSQYNSDTVGTRPVTWGHVKALYRTP
jgi:hypothetical protein